MTQTQPSRTDRRTQGRKDRRRPWIGGILALAVIVGVGLVVLALVARPSAAPPTERVLPEGPPATLGVFGIIDDPSLVTVVGVADGRPTVSMPIAQDALVPLPVVGSGTVSEAIAMSGSSGRTAVANLLGTWIPHYAFTDLEGLGRMVDRVGGITIPMPRVRLGGRTVGPGEVQLSGAQVVEYLSTRDADERALRWQEVNAGLFTQPLRLDERSVVSTDDFAAASRFFAQTRDGSVDPLPTEAISVGLRLAKPEVVQEAIAEAFGIVRGVPTAVVVLDGVEPCVGCGQMITDELLPLGYRVTAYGSERGHGQGVTLISVATRDLLPQGEQIRDALKVGRVGVTKSRSGLADITILVGEDFAGEPSREDIREIKREERAAAAEARRQEAVAEETADADPDADPTASPEPEDAA